MEHLTIRVALASRPIVLTLESSRKPEFVATGAKRDGRSKSSQAEGSLLAARMATPTFSHMRIKVFAN